MADFLNILSMIGSFLFMVFFFGSCVFVHELGHFMVAKWRGLHIDAFSIGFKKAWGKKINGVDYRIGYLPFGGYVELPQVDSSQDEIKAADGTILPKAKPIDRLLTALAGPLCNIIYGFLLACIVWWVGIPQDSPKMRFIEVAEVLETSPEYKAGLRAGDKIVKLNNNRFQSTWAEFAKDVLISIDKVTLDVERNGKIEKITYTPMVNKDAPGKLKYENIAWPFFEPIIPIELFPDKDSLAAKAGIKKGDFLLSIDGKKFTDYVEVFQYIAFSNKKELDFKIQRNNEIINIKATGEADTTMPKRYLMGITYNMSLPITISEVKENYAAAQAGLKVNDEVIKINDIEIKDANIFRAELAKDPVATKKLTIKRGDETLDIAVTPQAIEVCTIGLTVGLIDYPTPMQQFNATLDMSYKGLRSLVITCGNLLHLTDKNSSIKLRHMSGPIGIADTLYSAAHKSSIMTGLYFVVIICFALAIFNLLPLPVLDGGHIVFALIEIIFRRPIPTKIIRFVSIIFIFLLISLMVYVTFYDLLRLAPDSLRAKIDEKLTTTPTTEAPAK